MRRFYTLLFVATMLFAPIASRAGSYGTELPFVTGTGARASGLGLAAVSLPGAPSMQYYNPALLTTAQRMGFEFYRTTLFDSKSAYHAASYVHPSVDYGNAAITVLRLGVGGVEERDDVNNLLSTDLTNTQTRVLLGYAVELHPMLSAGLNLKVDNQSFGEFSGTGVGGDLGFLGTREFSKESIFRQVRVGVAVENLIEPSVKLDVEEVVDPLRLTLGASLDCRYDDFAFTTGLDVTHPRLSPTQLRFGQEVTYAQMFALRLGLDGTTATFGLGGTYRHASLDYAYRNEELGSNHRISLSVALGATRDERLAIRQERIDAQLRDRVQRRMIELEGDQLRGLTAGADSLFDANDFERAFDQYEMILLWSPEHAHSRSRAELCAYNVTLARAQALIDEADFLSARHQLRDAARHNPPDSRAAQLLATCDQHIAEAEDRSKMIDRLLRHSIDRYAESQYVDALRGFDEVLRLDPGNELAAEYQSKSRSNTTNASQRLITQARGRARSGEFDTAISMLKKARTLTPDNILIDRDIATIEKQRLNASAKVSKGGPTESPSVTTRSTVNSRLLNDKFENGVRLFEKGRFDQAANELLQVWTVAPDYRGVTTPLTKAYLFLGMKVYSEAKYVEAIRIWEKILTIDPGNVKARRYLEKTRQEAAKLGGMSNG